MQKPKLANSRIAKWKSLLIGVAYLSVTLIGLFWMYREAHGALGKTPQSDVQTYWEIAKQMTHPFHTDHREPVWIWLVKIAGFFADPAHLPMSAYNAIRILGLSTFFVAAQLWLWLLFTWSQRWSTALIGYSLFFPNRWLIKLAAGGTRDLGYLLFLILWLASLQAMARLPRRSKMATLSFGALSFALLVDNRLNSIFAVLAIYTAYAVMDRTRWKEILGVVCGGILLISPFLYFQNSDHGDPFYSVNVHGAWYRNTEFILIKKQGCPTCPSTIEVQNNGYAGPKITANQWLLGMHSPQQVISGTLLGYQSLFQKEFFKWMGGTSNSVLYFLFLLGSGVALLLGRGEVWMILLAITNLTPFLIDAVNVDPRIFCHFSLFVSLAVALGTELMFLISGLASQMLFPRRSNRSEATLTRYYQGSWLSKLT